MDREKRENLLLTANVHRIEQRAYTSFSKYIQRKQQYRTIFTSQVQNFKHEQDISRTTLLGRHHNYNEKLNNKD